MIGLSLNLSYGKAAHMGLIFNFDLGTLSMKLGVQFPSPHRINPHCATKRVEENLFDSMLRGGLTEAGGVRGDAVFESLFDNPFCDNQQNILLWSCVLKLN